MGESAKFEFSINKYNLLKLCNKIVRFHDCRRTNFHSAADKDLGHNELQELQRIVISNVMKHIKIGLGVES